MLVAALDCHFFHFSSADKWRVPDIYTWHTNHWKSHTKLKENRNIDVKYTYPSLINALNSPFCFHLIIQSGIVFMLLKKYAKVNLQQPVQLCCSIFQALVRDNNAPVLNPTYKALLWCSAIYPTQETTINEHNTRPFSVAEQMWDVCSASEVRNQGYT